MYPTTLRLADEDTMRPLSFSSFVCTLNLFLILFGYQSIACFTSGIVDYNTGTSFITWPYRGFAAFIAGLAFLCGRSRLPKMSGIMWLVLLFWILYITRAVYDLGLRPRVDFEIYEISEKPNGFFQAWAYVFVFTLLPLLSILRSWEQIDYARLLNWSLVMCTMSILVSLTGIEDLVGEYATQRSGFLALNPISYGRFGGHLLILACYKFFTCRSPIWKLLSIIPIVLGAYILLRAGSRGPILSLFVSYFVWIFVGTRFLILGIVLSIFGLLILYIYFEQILDLIHIISPVMATRISNSVYNMDSSGRDVLFSDYINGIFENPITGMHLDVISYSHNACIDGFVMFGVLFGWIVFAIILLAFIKASWSIKIRMQHYWISLILIDQLVGAQLSGAFGTNAIAWCLIVIIYSLYRSSDSTEASLRRG